MKLEKILGDQKQQEEGKWIRHDTGAEFKIRYSESKECRDYVAKRLTKARQKSRKAFVKSETLNEITLDLLILKVVVDWQNIEDNEGKPFEFNQINLRYVLEESAMLRDFVANEAADPENFGIEVDEEGESAEGASKSSADRKTPASAAL